MADKYFCNCHDCDRSYRNMLEHLEQCDSKLVDFKNHLKSHFEACTQDCAYSRLYTYLESKYPNGYGIEQLLEVSPEHRECICFYHWNRNAVIDDWFFSKPFWLAISFSIEKEQFSLNCSLFGVMPSLLKLRYFHSLFLTCSYAFWQHGDACILQQYRLGHYS